MSALPPAACEPGALSPTHGRVVARSDVIPDSSERIPVPGPNHYVLTPMQQQIADFAWDAQNQPAWSLPIAVFAVFCLPLIWYFSLDRIRELGAAISGRGRDS